MAIGVWISASVTNRKEWEEDDPRHDVAHDLDHTRSTTLPPKPREFASIGKKLPLHLHLQCFTTTEVIATIIPEREIWQKSEAKHWGPYSPWRAPVNTDGIDCDHGCNPTAMKTQKKPKKIILKIRKNNLHGLSALLRMATAPWQGGQWWS
jgi:hypothetical protein